MKNCTPASIATTLRRGLGFTLLFLLTALPLWADRVSTDTRPGDLKTGDWVWDPAASPTGPVVVVVSVTEQRTYVYRNGILIAYTSVATGKPGHETPTGVFTVLEKDKDHVSNLYNAKMPNTERLTWTGICLHAGSVPGYPNSHGCVHLPLEFSRLLYELDQVGTTVVIADDHSGPAEGAHPGLVLSPLLHEPDGPVTVDTKYRWEPSRSATGPVSLLLSTAEGQLYVYRNGLEIGAAAVHIPNPEHAVWESVFTILEGKTAEKSPFDPKRPMNKWMAVALSSGDGPHMPEVETTFMRLHVPHQFGKQVYDLLSPGTTLLITAQAAAPRATSDEDFVVMATHQGEPEKQEAD